MKVLLIFFFVLTALSSYGQLVEIKGIVLREDSLTPIYGAVIYNKNSFLGTISNKNGNFKMRVKAGDTLVVSHLSFLTSLVVFENTNFSPNEKIHVNLKIRSYELPVIDVRRYRIRERTPKPMSMRRTDNIVYNMGTMKIEQLSPYYNNPHSTGIPGVMPGYALTIPDFKEIKRQEQLAKVAEMEKKDRAKRYVNYKYNKSIVNRLTGLNGNELENFMNFCKPTDKTITEASEYEMTYYILDCYDRFIQENE